MAAKRVMMSMALVVPAAAGEVAVNVSTLANLSASLRGSSMMGDCADWIPGCDYFAAAGLCSHVAEYCPLTCGRCTPPASDPSCTASWAHNCNSNPTCCEAGFMCYQKTPSWAACLRTCTPGIVQPGDDGKQIPWTCAVIGGGGQQPTPEPVPTPSPPASDPSCTASWAHNCNSNPTCCEAGFTCYQKSPSWAACLKTCMPGIVQPGDDGKQIPWTCAVIGGGGAKPTPEPVPTPSPPASDPSCTASWAHNCNSNPTCCEAGFKCYEKSPSWAACLKTCTPGIVQPNDDGEQIPWTCEVLGGEEDCTDKQDQCGAWAENGECSANPDYMHQSCRLSCGLCQTCTDQHDQCAEWAADNQCAENPGYMHTTCKKSCGLCN